MAGSGMKMRIGEVAGMAGVNVQTLRYYERLGLLEEPHRRASGYREYPDETVFQIRFIKRAQELGFSLKEIEELINLQKRGGGACATVYTAARAKIREVEGKIESLGAIKATLESLLSSCTPRSDGECVVIGELRSRPEPPKKSGASPGEPRSRERPLRSRRPAWPRSERA
jgi:MerR family mercuric resistance operon transcriptional regulator